MLTLKTLFSRYSGTLRRLAAGLTLAMLAGCGANPDAPETLKVVLIPADGGTESGTRADFAPVFEAVGRETNLSFDLSVAQNYSTAVEALCAGHADIAFLGPATFVQASERGCADFLAVAVKDGASQYYSGLFVRADSPVRTLADLKGKRAGFGDINSTSSFLVPVGMLIEAGIDPARDLSKVALLDSHANSLAALMAGQVDVAALSFESFDKAVANGAVRPDQVRVLARSAAIPYPPLVVRRQLPADRKQQLRNAFDAIAQNPDIDPEMIRGYGGQKVDGYRASVDPEAYVTLVRTLERVTPEIRAELVTKASTR